VNLPQSVIGLFQFSTSGVGLNVAGTLGMIFRTRTWFSNLNKAAVVARRRRLVPLLNDNTPAHKRA